MDIFDIDIQKTQALRFVNLNRYSLPQNYDDRLILDLIYPRTRIPNDCQQFESTDYLSIHYRTNYTVYTILLIDSNGNETDITSLQEYIYTDSSDRAYYNLPIDISGLSGNYYITIELNQALKVVNTFRSEPFNISANVPNSTWIECYGNERSYNDGQHWSDDNKQGIRIVSSLRDYEFAQSKNVYEPSDYVPETLKSKPNRVVVLNVDKDSQYMLERIHLFLNHDEFYVNGVRYNNDEPVSVDPLGNLLNYKAQIKLIESDYQNGESRGLTGDVPPEPPPGETFKTLINDTDYTLINNSDNLLIN